MNHSNVNNKMNSVAAQRHREREEEGEGEQVGEVIE